MLQSRLAFLIVAAALALGLCSLAAPGLVAQEKKGASKSKGEALTDPDEIFRSNLAEFAEGRNVILATVDGEVITSELMRAEYGSQLASNVREILQRIESQKAYEIATYRAENGERLYGEEDYEKVTTQSIELKLLYARARQYALSELLLDIADKAQLPIQDSNVRAFLRTQQELAGIDPEDGEAWADYTLERFGLTPEAYLDRLKKEARVYTIRSALLGDYGPMQVPPFPFPSYSLDVTEEEKYERYMETEDQWKKIGSITFSRMSVLIPQSALKEDKDVIEARLSYRRDQIEQGQLTLSELAETLEEVFEDYAEVGVQTEAELEIVETKEQSIGRGAFVLRSLDIGKISEVTITQTNIDNDPYTVIYFVQVHDKQEGIAREFLDPYVQRLLADELKQEKRSANELRLDAELFRRAVVVPEGVFDVSTEALRRGQ